MTENPMTICYFSSLFKCPRGSIAVMAHEAKNPKFGRVDFIVGIGLSGTLPLLELHKATGIPVLPLRKNTNDSHRGQTMEPGRDDRYLIVDDFVSTGNTLSKVRAYLANCECAGVLLYQSEREGTHADGVPVTHCWLDALEVERLLKKGFEL